MVVSLIAAMSLNRVIASQDRIPWDLPEDRKRFREITGGYPVVLGRKTFESMEGPLPGRKNIVLTRRPGLSFPGCTMAADLESALYEHAGDPPEVFVCGGGQVYRQAVPLAHKIYLTTLLREVEGDVFFPEIPGDEFSRTYYEEIPAADPFSFAVYERVLQGTGP
ncbi:MAG: dihydrofolate reductase [Candidatus Glassbacteria bacterium]|nr:dihydrofolate reductase [Candidatus Glassbacteria bacterium]